MPALMIVDCDGVIRFWDAAAETQFGYAAADVTGKPMDFLIVPSHRERHWAGFSAAMARAVADLDQPVANAPITHADGAIRYSPLRFVTIADTTGRPAGMLAVFGAPVEPGGANGLPDLFPDAFDAQARTG